MDLGPGAALHGWIWVLVILGVDGFGVLEILSRWAWVMELFRVDGVRVLEMRRLDGFGS